MATAAQRFESDRAKYPAMQIDEVLVWIAWLQLHQQEYDRFDYNVTLGPQKDPGPAYPENIRRMAILIRSSRLDAVGWRGNQPTIFEVERRADPRGLGQIITYGNLWRADPTLPQPPLLAMVAAELQGSIAASLAGAGITLYQVPGVNFSLLAPGRVTSA